MKPLKPKPTITQLGNSLNQPEFFSRPSFWMPELMISSGWIAHAPFAFWLTEVLQPKTLVELGTHHGYSYFAFCQAVQRLELDTRCYAIDNWEGDEHTGFYGEEVFHKVKDYNDSRYSSFSRLIRSTFDGALEDPNLIGEVLFDNFLGVALHLYFAPPEINGFIAKPGDVAQGMGDVDDGGTLHHLIDFFKAFDFKLGVANGKNFINQQNLRFKKSGY